MKRWLAVFLISMSCFLIGCGNDDDDDENSPPTIDAMVVPETANAGEEVEFQVVANDLDGDELTYLWTVDGSPLSTTTSTVTWTVPEKGGKVAVRVTVSDGINTSVVSQLTLTVASKPGTVEALYEELVGTYDLFKAEITLTNQSKQVLEPPDATGTMTMSSNRRITQELTVFGITVKSAGTYEILIDEGIILITNDPGGIVSRATYTWDGSIFITTIDTGIAKEKDFWQKQ